MNQKTALIVSAGITSFMLAIGGGAAIVANRASVSAESVAVQPAASGDLSAQRESQYQQLINQANSQIKQANAEITLLKEQLRQAQSPTTVQFILASQAQTIAMNAVPNATVLRTPDLVDYQGTPSYEVVLDKGTLYIDAKTGAILANGAAVQVDTQIQGEQRHTDNESHESGEDD